MPSNVILAMRYDSVREELLIAFRTRREAYRYFNVPLEEWDAFLEAESKGTYLNRIFKQKDYPYEKTDEVVRFTGQRHAGRPLFWGEARTPRKNVQRIELPSQRKKVRA